MCILSSSEKRRKERARKEAKYLQRKKRPWLAESDRSERDKHNLECIEIDEDEEGEY